MPTPRAKSADADPHRVIADHGRAVYGVSCAADGRILSAGFPARPARGAPHQVRLWSRTGESLGGFGSGEVVCHYAAMSPDGRTVAAGLGDCTLRLWDVASDDVRTLGVLGGIVASLAWSTDGSRLFTGNCGDNTVRLWDVPTGRVIAEGKTKKSATWVVALAPDGERAVSGSADKLVHVWHPATGAEVGTLSGHEGRITSLRFSPDGRLLASASQDRTARVWDLATGKTVCVLDGHRKQVTCVAFFPDGAHIATTSGDRTMRVWTADGRLLHTFSTGAPLVESIAIAPDGTELIAGGDDGLLRGFPTAGVVGREQGDAIEA